MSAPIADQRELRSDRLFALAVGGATVLLVAALTHFSVILLLPDVSTKDAYNLLAARSGVYKLTLLAPSKPGDTLIPFRDPANVQGLCFYDVSKGPARVRTKTEEGRLLTLSFRTPDGKIFYSMTDRAAFHDTIDIRLVTPAQLDSIEETDDESQGLPSELRLRVLNPRGLMVATALIARPSERQDAEKRIEGITCASEPLPPS